MKVPTEGDACAVVERALGANAVVARRFPTGLCHFVFEVQLTDGRVVVARLAGENTQGLLAGGVYWQQRLRPLGVPLAAQLQADLSAPIPYVLLERLPGSDLGAVYTSLDENQKRAVAAAVVDAQIRTARMPEAAGFGHALSYEDPALMRRQSWHQVVTESLARSRQRILSAGVVDVTLVDRLSPWLRKFETYFARIRPTPFLDDTTTKNVIVHHGRLAGIVDVDEVCFGDPLFTVGLTQMALLQQGAEISYVGHWLSLLAAKAEDRAVVDFYTAVFCLDFLGEIGRPFNREPTAVDFSKVAALQQILGDLLNRL